MAWLDLYLQNTRATLVADSSTSEVSAGRETETRNGVEGALGATPLTRTLFPAFRTMTAICFVCNLPILTHQVGLKWKGGNGWDDLVREQLEEATLKERLGKLCLILA